MPHPSKAIEHGYSTPVKRRPEQEDSPASSSASSRWSPIALITVALSRLKPAAPTVDRGTAYLDTVKRGPMVRQVRGLGTLVPEDIRWIPAATDGRVERIVVYPGTPVTPDTVILELSNPTQSQALLEAEQQLKAAEAQYANLQVQVANDLLAQEAATSAVARRRAGRRSCRRRRTRSWRRKAWSRR